MQSRDRPEERGWCQENILKGPTWLWGVRVKVREPHGS